MLFNLKQLFSFSNLFDQNPLFNRTFLIWSISFYGGILIVSTLIFLLLKNPNYRGFKNRLFTSGLTCGLMGLLLVFFRFEQISFLAANFWHLILIIIYLVWLGLILKYLIRQVPKEVKERKEQAWRNQFLPRPKLKK